MPVTQCSGEEDSRDKTAGLVATLCQRNMVEWYRRTPNIPLWPLHMHTTTRVHTPHTYKHKPFFFQYQGYKKTFQNVFYIPYAQIKAYLSCDLHSRLFLFISLLCFLPLFHSLRQVFCVATAGFVHWRTQNFLYSVVQAGSELFIFLPSPPAAGLQVCVIILDFNRLFYK